MKQLSEEEWKKKLTPEQYRVLREKGTERPFSSSVVTNNEEGMYVCAACGHELFSSKAKYDLDPSDPNYGWPSFDQPANRENVELRSDDSLGMHRTEVVCKHCGSHLGHLFDDGPKETRFDSHGKARQAGEHYCINGCALSFKKQS